MADHDAYIQAAPAAMRPLLERLRAQLRAALPEAVEVVKYNRPGFEIDGSVVAGYAAFSKQCGIYVAPGAIAAHRDDIAAAGYPFVGLNLLQSSVTGFCPAATVLRKAGLSSGCAFR